MGSNFRNLSVSLVIFKEEDSLLSLDNISTGLRIGATVVSIAGLVAAALSANEKDKSRK